MKDFVASAANAYTSDQIRIMEMKICRALKWRLVPATIFTWVNLYMTKWDSFLEREENLKLMDTVIQFKKNESKTYFRFRELLEYMDAASLDVITLRYNVRELAVSFMYLILGRDSTIFSTDEIKDIFAKTGTLIPIDKSTHGFIQVFSDFLAHYCGFTLTEMVPTMQYAASFFGLPIYDWDLPQCITQEEYREDNSQDGVKTRKVTSSTCYLTVN